MQCTDEYFGGENIVKFVHGEWANKNAINASKRYERKQDEVPGERRIRRNCERMLSDKIQGK